METNYTHVTAMGGIRIDTSRILVQVYDEQSGRMVDQQGATLDHNGTTQQTINVSQVPSGRIYTVKVLHEQGGVGTTRSVNPE